MVRVRNVLGWGCLVLVLLFVAYALYFWRYGDL
jgi:hypothetical protein